MLPGILIVVVVALALAFLASLAGWVGSYELGLILVVSLMSAFFVRQLRRARTR